jgi:tRNA 5-methylaminomethyl-2-thiouridine biosynthesis bifunctional protein
LLLNALGGVQAAGLKGAVGFRCVAPDRMPSVGAMPDVDAARA